MTGMATSCICPRMTHAVAFLAAWVAACGVALAKQPIAPAARPRPNIIFVFSDDHAQRAISAYGSVVNHTPHIDRLAAAGARFVNSFVTNSICTPSRATLLTGQYSHVNGVPVFNRFDGSRDHVAKRLRAGGYHTGMIGKWHLGCEPTGFDRWAVLPGQGAYWNPTFLVPGHSVSIRGHVTEITVDLGIEFLETRPRDRPFFLMLHHKAPHRAWEPDERNQARFREAVIPEPETLFDDWHTRPAALPENRQTIARDLTPHDLKRPPPAGLAGRELTAWKYQRYMQDYLACVQGVDDAMGRLLDHLERSGLADDTIVLYSSDNGWYMGELGLYDKRFMYEPGLPVPESMQGRSLEPLLRGQAPADWRTSVYYRYYHDPGHHDTRQHHGVRTATHKLIHYPTKRAWELFDVAADPHEQHNLLHDAAQAARPEVAELFAAMKTELERLQREYGDDGRYADPASWPTGGVDGAFGGRPLGERSVRETIAASAAMDGPPRAE